MACRAACLLCALLAACTVELAHGLDEHDANEAVAALGHAGVASDKLAGDKPGLFTIVVARVAAADALAALSSRDLPRRRGKGVGEAFADSGLVPSPGAERARLSASLAADLERTLEAIPGVELARVHLALPDPDPLRGESARPRSTASVLLRARNPLVPDADEIRRMVAAAVEGMLPADVHLVVAAALSDGTQGEISLATLGPIELTARSRSLSIALVAAALSTIAVLAMAVAALLLRRRARPGYFP